MGHIRRKKLLVVLSAIFAFTMAFATLFAVMPAKLQTAYATSSTVTIDFSEKGFTNKQKVTTVEQDGVTVTFSIGAHPNTQPAYYDVGTAIRCYCQNSFTVSVAQGTINEIVFTFGSGDSKKVDILCSSGTFNTNTWTGNKSSVTFVVDQLPGDSLSRRFKVLDVTVDTEGQEDEAVFVAQVGDNTYENFDAAFSACPADGTVKFLTDLDLSDKQSEWIIVKRNLTVDLNGHVLTMQDWDSNTPTPLYVYQGMKLTLTNSAPAQGGFVDGISLGSEDDVKAELIFKDVRLAFAADEINAVVSMDLGLKLADGYEAVNINNDGSVTADGFVSIVQQIGSSQGEESTVNFVKVTSADNLTEENIGTCTEDEARQWVLNHWDELVNTSAGFVDVAFNDGTGLYLFYIEIAYEDKDGFEDGTAEGSDKGDIDIDYLQDYFYIGQDVYICEVAASEPTTAHTHNYSTEWNKDETNHWHNCIADGKCDAPKSDEAAHTYGEDINETAYYNCTVCGHEDATRKAAYEDNQNSGIELPDAVYIAGDFNSWVTGSDTYKMTIKGKVCTITLNDVPIGDHIFKFCGKTFTEFDYGADDELDMSSSTGVEVGTVYNARQGGANIKFTLTAVSDVTIMFDASTEIPTFKITEITPSEVTPAHTHDYDTAWNSDETNHWHACIAEGDCDAPKIDQAAHTYGDDITATAYYTCSVCGYENGTRKTEYENAQQGGGEADVGFGKVTDDSQIKSENIDQCTLEKAKGWVTVFWDDVKNTDAANMDIAYYDGTDLYVIYITASMTIDDFYTVNAYKVIVGDLIVYYSIGHDVYLCGFEGGSQGSTHVHSYDTDWSSDISAHWHACIAEGICDEPTKDVEAHTYGDDITATAYYTCSVCGYENTTRKAEYEDNQSDGHVNLSYTYENADDNIYWTDKSSSDQGWIVSASNTLDESHLLTVLYCETGSQVVGEYPVSESSGGRVCYNGENYNFTAGSCILTVNGNILHIEGTFNATDGNTYDVSIDYALTPAHTHNLTYAVSGATITATCDNADGNCTLENNKATLTINAPTALIYDGTAKEATLSEYDAEVFTDVVIKYFVGNTEVSDCINAGTYVAKVSAGGVTAEVEFTIQNWTIDKEDKGVVVEIEGSEEKADITVEVEVKTDVSSEQAQADYSQIAGDKLGKNEKVAYVYDVKLIRTEIIGGVETKTEIQPSDVKAGTTVVIKMTIPENLRGKYFKVLHIHSDEEVEIINDFVISEDGTYLTVRVSKLSEFAFITDKDVSTHGFCIGWIVVILDCLMLVYFLFYLLLIVTALKKIREKVKADNVEDKKNLFGLIGLCASGAVLIFAIIVIIIHTCIVSIIGLILAVLIFIAFLSLFLMEKKNDEEKAVTTADPIDQSKNSEYEQPEENDAFVDKGDKQADEADKTGGGISLKENLAMAVVSTRKERITKADIAAYLGNKHPDNVEVNRRDNYTKTGLPLADTHYVTADEKKTCFIYVYETEGATMLLLKTKEELGEELAKDYKTVRKSAFPKAKDKWYSVVIDDSLTNEQVENMIDRTIALYSGKPTQKKPVKAIKTVEKVTVAEATAMIEDEVAASYIEVDKTAGSYVGKKDIVNVDTLSENFNDGDTITIDALKEKQLVPAKSKQVKLLARGTLDKKLFIELQDYSIEAVKMVIATGGTVKRV